MWIVTNSGKRFNYETFDPDSVCLEDIAHALSYQCRFNGHSHAFYSVAEHSLLLANYFSTKYASANRPRKQARCTFLVKQALLHDATEAYLADIPAPFKSMMPEYRAYERDLMGNIFEKYGLVRDLDKEVEDADIRISLNEKAKLFPSSFPRWEMEDVVKPLDGVEISCFTPDVIYPIYLTLLRGVFNAV